ncbi:MAG TPA: universal stress protein, partial [Longimicrobium sp.]|nr:universal stress protein [Longimicrobium sp.]
MASSIVCAVDDSPHARAAARLTADLAQRLGLAPIAVHAYLIAARAAARTHYPVFPVEDHLEDRQRGAAQRAVEILSSAGVRDVRVRAELGAVAQVVSAVAEEEDAALIALGT